MKKGTYFIFNNDYVLWVYLLHVGQVKMTKQ